MDTYTKTMITIITVCVVVVTLLLVGSLIFDGHDHDDEHDYGYVEELYEKLEYINHRVDELEERLKEISYGNHIRDSIFGFCNSGEC